MRLPWWPIVVKAELESDGFRVVSNEAADRLPVDTLMPWTRYQAAADGSSLDSEGKKLRKNGYPIQFRAVRSKHNGIKSRQAHWQQVRRAWFSDRTNQFEIDTLPGGAMRAAFKSAAIELYFGIILLVAGAGMLLPALDGKSPEARTLEVWIACGILLISIGLLIRACLAISRARSASWVVSINSEGVELRNRGARRRVPWSEISMRKKDGLLYLLLIEGSERAYLVPSPMVRAVLVSRIQGMKPKLLTPGFFLIGFIAAMMGPCIHWAHQFLQTPSMNDYSYMFSLFSPLILGVFGLSYLLELREFRKVNESTEPEIPMNP